MTPAPPLLDGFGRAHTYLRLSVTDRCNFRCAYCVPPEGVRWMPRPHLLTYEEHARLVRIFARLGIRKVRLTGGEPTVRRDIARLVAAIAAVEGIGDLAMTTNGARLAQLAEELARAGLHRVNVSLDTLRPDRFREITGGGRLTPVLEGIEAALAAGLVPLKLNAVVLEGANDDEVEDLVEWALARAPAAVLRFIEVMPFGTWRFRPVPGAVLRERIARRYRVERPHEGPTASDRGPARDEALVEGRLRVAFVSPLSARFCEGCNRLRLMADGHLRTCLAHEDTPSLRDLLRGGATDDEIALAIRTMVRDKPEGHRATLRGGAAFEGVMTSIGG